MVAEEQTHFVSLRKRSQQVQNAVEMTHGRLKVMEEELCDFLDHYYARVGGAFEELTSLRSALEQVTQGCFSMNPKVSEPPTTPLGKSESIRQLYYEMARECHPDMAAQEDGADAASLKSDMMKTLNAAYARKSLSEMWKLKWDLERRKHDGALDHKQRLELLRTQQTHMQNTLDELQQRESELKESAAWQLMQHARLMQCCGQDFTQMVKGRVESQIAQAKRELRAARHQAKYWSHVRMEKANGTR